jgi:hypothetical protein
MGDMNIKAIVFVVMFLLASMTATGTTPPREWFLYWLDKDSDYYMSPGDKTYRASSTNVFVVTKKENLAIGHYWYIGEIYSCPTEEYTVTSINEFDRNDKVIKLWENPDPLQTWKLVLSSERQASVYNGVCTRLLGRPSPVDEVRNYFKENENDVKNIRGRR